MKNLILSALLVFLFSCSNASKEKSAKSVEEYRTEASAADKEALRLNNIRTAVEEELLLMDSIYYYSGENPKYKIKIDSLLHIIDSLDVLIDEQCEIMNKAQHNCDSIHNTWAI